MTARNDRKPITERRRVRRQENRPLREVRIYPKTLYVCLFAFHFRVRCARKAYCRCLGNEEQK